MCRFAAEASRGSSSPTSTGNPSRGWPGYHCGSKSVAPAGSLPVTGIVSPTTVTVDGPSPTDAPRIAQGAGAHRSSSGKRPGNASPTSTTVPAGSTSSRRSPRVLRGTSIVYPRPVSMSSTSRASKGRGWRASASPSPPTPAPIPGPPPRADAPWTSSSTEPPWSSPLSRPWPCLRRLPLRPLTPSRCHTHSRRGLGAPSDRPGAVLRPAAARLHVFEPHHHHHRPRVRAPAGASASYLQGPARPEAQVPALGTPMAPCPRSSGPPIVGYG